MTQYTYDEQIVSDLHKDAYGYRPREGFWRHWNESTSDEKQEIWDGLLRDLDAEMEAEQRRKDEAVEAFEARVEKTVAMGAGDRLTAIRWIVDGMDLDYTDLCYGGERICWELGLPYSMSVLFTEACEALKTAKKEAA